MATKVMRTLSIHRQEGRDGVIICRHPGEEASQDYKAGAPLVYDGGEPEIWAGTTDASTIIGIAAKDATEIAGSDVPIYEANPYNLFEGSMVDGTAAYTVLGTEIGNDYSLVASGDDWYVDVADTTTSKVEIVGLIDAVDDINGRCIFRFLGDMQGRNLRA